MALTRRKYILFVAAASLLSVALALVVALAADLYLQRRAERSAGLNRWGYRGPILGRKQPGEVRVALLGGSTMFGYGATWDEAIPALLERDLNQRYPERTWRGLNLGYNTEGAFAFVPNLEAFEYLAYDVVGLYEGYNDMVGDEDPNHVVVREQSPIFRATGYFPILPLAFREKAMALRSGGDLEASYSATRGEPAKTVFRPGVASRTSAGALDAAAAIADSMGRQFEHLSDKTPVPSVNRQLDCPSPWASYCDSMYRAVRYALDQGKRVLVMGQPRPADASGRARHEDQQRALAGMVARQFGNEPRVTYLSLATAVDLADADKSFDQMHLSVDGNRLVAAAMVESVRRLALTP